MIEICRQDPYYTKVGKNAREIVYGVPYNNFSRTSSKLIGIHLLVLLVCCYNPIMISKYKHKGLNWVDLESPTEEEIAYILEEYTIPIFIKDEISSYPKNDIVRLDYGFTFAHLNLSRVPHAEKNNNRLIFIANDNFIVLIHDEPIDNLRELSKDMELDTLTEEKFGSNNNKLLFAHLLKNIYTNSQKQIFERDARIKHLQDKITKNNKKSKSIIIYILLSLLTVILLLLICL